MIGDHVTAISDYQIFIENYDSNDASTWYSLGTAQLNSDLNEVAVQSLSRALELDASYYQAYINRGLAYIDLKKYEEALNDFNHALEFGDIPAAYSGRGKTYYHLMLYDDAIVDLELARAMMPYRPTSYCFLALSYFEVGRYQDTLDTAAQFDQIERECGGQRLFEVQARSYYELGDYEQAVEYMNKAMEMGEYKMGYYYRGVMFQAANRSDEAILDLEHFLLLDPSNELINEIIDAKARLEQLKK